MSDLRDACGAAATALETLVTERRGELDLWAIAVVLRRIHTSAAPMTVEDAFDAARYMSVALKLIADYRKQG